MGWRGWLDLEHRCFPLKGHRHLHKSHPRRRFSREGEVSEFLPIVERIRMECFQHREPFVQAVEPCWGGDRPRSFHLSPRPSHPKRSGAFGQFTLRAHPSPHPYASLPGDQPSFEHRLPGFRFPARPWMPRLFQQFEVRFDPPPVVVPQGPLCIRHVVGQVGQPIPLCHRAACGGVEAADHPLGLNDRVQRAYDAAVANVSDATALVDVTVQENWFWWFIGTARCVTLTGEAVK